MFLVIYGSGYVSEGIPSQGLPQKPSGDTVSHLNTNWDNLGGSERALLI